MENNYTPDRQDKWNRKNFEKKKGLRPKLSEEYLIN
jgi:hypothetical protein